MDAQREAVNLFVRPRGTIVAEYIEVESGKKIDRPQLTAALAECRKGRAVLVIAKLDRLARNVHFISGLMNSDVEFVAVDMPTASRLTIHILAAVAEHEREMISQRTKAALAAAKARGIKLGNPRPAEALTKARAAILRLPPDPDALDLIFELRMQGFSLRQIADRLNARQIRASKGGRWHPSTVSSALERLDVIDKARLPESTKERKRERVTWRRNEIVSIHSSRLNDRKTRAMPCFAASSAGREVTKHRHINMFNLYEANRMLDTFASVGAAHFDVTFTDIEGEKRGFRPHQSVRQLRNSLPQLAPGLEERQQNIIVRPHCDKYQIIQLDDLNYEQLKPLAPVSFLILETSPGNHQAWVAVSGVEGDGKDFARRLRKGTEADATASGATRLGGTPNFKRKYEPDFPTVKILQAAPGRTTTAQQLEAFGLVAAPEPVAPATPLRVFSDNGRSWPDYQRCVQGAPIKHGENKPDISRADFFWAMMACQRGWDTSEVASRLMELSSKAKENGQRYAEITAENAAAACDRQRRSRA